MNKNAMSWSGNRDFFWAPVPTRKGTQIETSKVMLQFTDPQHGGTKIGQAVKILTDMHSHHQMIEEINKFCSKCNGDANPIGILFDNFDGDVIANFGREGAAEAWKAYLKGFGNLYCDSGIEATTSSDKMIGNRIMFLGMLDADDLQEKALKLADTKREVESNKQLCTLVSQHSARLENFLSHAINTKLATLFVLSGGDNAIYACIKTVKMVDNDVVVLRFDRHMDERDLSLRSDPRVKPNELHPHSGNGITQAKNEQLISYDFLLGCDYERNNDQCIRNSRKYSQTCRTEIISMDKMRLEPRFIIDDVIKQVDTIMRENRRADLVINIDSDTFNGIPASAETFTGGLDSVWAYYLLHKLSDLPRPPKIIRIAELQYSGDELRRNIAVDFAAEVLKAGVKAIQTFRCHP